MSQLRNDFFCSLKRAFLSDSFFESLFAFCVKIFFYFRREY